MKEWFESLEQRERRIMIAGAVVLLVMSVYFLGVDPFLNKKASLQRSTVELQQDLAWMQAHVDEVTALRRNNSAPARPATGQSLLGTIDRTAKSKKLSDSVKRIQPDGTSKARVWLDNAQFDKVIPWLEELQRRQGINVESAMLEKQDKDGLVSARIVFVAAE